VSATSGIFYSSSANLLLRTKINKPQKTQNFNNLFLRNSAILAAIKEYFDKLLIQ